MFTVGLLELPHVVEWIKILLTIASFLRIVKPGKKD